MTFREFFRVLAPGGRFVNLETSQPPGKFLRLLFHLFVKAFVKPVGFLISKSRAGYAYLASSILRFYDAEILAEILRDAGYAEVAKKRLLFGVAAIHLARKC